MDKDFVPTQLCCVFTGHRGFFLQKNKTKEDKLQFQPQPQRGGERAERKNWAKKNINKKDEESNDQTSGQVKKTCCILLAIKCRIGVVHFN